MTALTGTGAAGRTGTSVIQAPAPPHTEQERQTVRPAGSSPPRGNGPRVPRHRREREPSLRQDIQGLRALAVTLVVLAHAGVPLVAGGYVGVDVFFVISGFLITGGLIGEAHGSGSVSLRRFYARRALRILPPATLVALATMAGCRFFASKLRYVEFLHDASAGALYLMNIDLAASGTDYLREGAAPSPFQHFWSLSVEEQYYLVWPVVLLVGWKCFRRTWLKALPLVVLCLLSLGLAVGTGESSPSWSYFGPHTRLWELGAGSLLAFGGRALGRLPRLLAEACTWLGLGGIVASALLYDDTTPFPGYHALLPVAATVLVIAGGCAPSRPSASRLLSVRPATWLGMLSYGWYLWHWPLLVIGPAALAREATPRLSLVLALCALVAAWLTLHLVENPIRHHRALRRRPGAALAVGLGLSTVVVVTSVVAAWSPPAISSAAGAPSLNAALTGADNPRAALAELLSAPATSLPRNLSPGLTDIKGHRSAVYRDSCHVDYSAERSPGCVYGDRTSDKVVVLFGDSHAAQWFPALDGISRQQGWKLVSLTKSSCKTADVMTVAQNRPYTSCDTWRKRALRRIGDLRPFLVVTSSSEAATPVEPMTDPPREWRVGYERVYRQLDRYAGHLVVLLDTPWPRSDAVECASSRPLDLPACERDQRDAVRSPVLREASRQAAARTGATLLDPKPWLCPPRGRCPFVVGDTFVYRDESHVAESYAEALTPVLRQELRASGSAG
ncbi:acyltransferase family protein [Streptomyces sp. NPDC001185]|uniref:acyltransferase family protein n=1 Tax=Streptomyces sp. NPDC001185 TaxID=3154380 RepID=UPI0033287D87